MFHDACVARDHMPPWIVDTGTAYHLQSTGTVDEGYLRVSPQPRSVRSANGVFVMDKETDTTIPSLGPHCPPQQMRVWDKTPNALSVGRLVCNHGFSFVWKPGKKPCLVKPKGGKIWMTVRKYVPYLEHLPVPSMNDPGLLSSENSCALP